ncbi:MAG: CIA30 family protein [Armatimonadetes bacterium]|nr:CIA30 family protein [Armatimonadota bacterium]
MVTRALMLTCLVMSRCLTWAQDEGVLRKLDFEKDLGGFASADPLAELGVTTTEGFAFKGAGALELWYPQRAIKPGDAANGLPGSLILPTEGGLPGLKAVRFAATAEISTALSVMLAEGGEDGPRYSAFIWCEGGEWAEYEIGIDDFHYDRDSGADPDGKLTPESVEAVVLVDVGCFFRLLAQQNPMFHVAPAAEQVVMLDEFELCTVEPEKGETQEGTVLIQDYAWPLEGVALLGGSKVKTSAVTQEGAGAALKVEYEVPAQSVFALVHQVRPGSLEGIKTLQLQVKSEKATTLVVDLEERTGRGEEKKANYSAMVQLQAGDDWQTVELPMTEFKRGEDSMDENGKLDSEHIVMAMVIDGGALINQADVANTLQLRGFLGLK